VLTRVGTASTRGWKKRVRIFEEYNLGLQKVSGDHHFHFKQRVAQELEEFSKDHGLPPSPAGSQICKGQGLEYLKKMSEDTTEAQDSVSEIIWLFNRCCSCPKVKCTSRAQKKTLLWNWFLIRFKQVDTEVKNSLKKRSAFLPMF
jgi:hypothetical protein